MWRKESFEITGKPEEGDGVQYAVLHVLQLRRFGIPEEVVKFFMREYSEEEPIYEKLVPGEVLIITKEGDNGVTYAANENGKVVLKRAKLGEED